MYMHVCFAFDFKLTSEQVVRSRLQHLFTAIDKPTDMSVRSSWLDSLKCIYTLFWLSHPNSTASPTTSACTLQLLSTGEGELHVQTIFNKQWTIIYDRKSQCSKYMHYGRCKSYNSGYCMQIVVNECKLALFISFKHAVAWKERKPKWTMTLKVPFSLWHLSQIMPHPTHI